MAEKDPHPEKAEHGGHHHVAVWTGLSAAALVAAVGGTSFILGRRRQRPEQPEVSPKIRQLFEPETTPEEVGLRTTRRRQVVAAAILRPLGASLTEVQGCINPDARRVPLGPVVSELVTAHVLRRAGDEAEQRVALDEKFLRGFIHDLNLQNVVFAEVRSMDETFDPAHFLAALQQSDTP